MKRALIVAAVILVLGVTGAVAALALTPGGLSPGPASDRHPVPAPIDALRVVAEGSSPTRYLAQVTAGLPSGCAKPSTHEVARAGSTLTVTVLNTMPNGDPVCTMIYGSYELSIDLGTGFRPGETYTVRAGDKTASFTAR